MTKREYVKPNCVEFGNLTEDTKYNLIGNGRDGAYPDKITLEEALQVGPEVFGS